MGLRDMGRKDAGTRGLGHQRREMWGLGTWDARPRGLRNVINKQYLIFTTNV